MADAVITMNSTRLESHGAVRHLVLDAPERLNALNSEMLMEMAGAIDTVAADPDARVLIVRAEGRAFCSGADVRSLFGDLTRTPAEIRDDLKQVYASFLGLRELKIPTIAAVNGIAVGAGVNIALACDIVFVGSKAKYSISFADIGLHPGGGCSWFLTRRMGADRALAAVLGAEVIAGEELVNTGLATKYVDQPAAAAEELAAKIAARAPGLVRDMVRAVQISETSELATALEFESWAQASSATSEVFKHFVEGFGK